MRNKLIVKEYESVVQAPQSEDQAHEKLPGVAPILEQPSTSEVSRTNLPSYSTLRREHPGNRYLDYLKAIRKSHPDHLYNHFNNYDDLGIALSLIHINLAELEPNAAKNITDWLLFNGVWKKPYEDSFPADNPKSPAPKKTIPANMERLLSTNTKKDGQKDIYDIPFSNIINAIIHCVDDYAVWTRLKTWSVYHYPAAINYYLKYVYGLINGRILTINNSWDKETPQDPSLVTAMSVLKDFTLTGIRKKLMGMLSKSLRDIDIYDAEAETVDVRKVLDDQFKSLCKIIGLPYTDKPIDAPITQEMLGYPLKTILEHVKKYKNFKKASAVLIHVEDGQILKKYLQHIETVLSVKAFDYDNKSTEKLPYKVERFLTKKISANGFIKKVEYLCRELEIPFDKPLYADMQSYSDAITTYTTRFSSIDDDEEIQPKTIQNSHIPTTVLGKRNGAMILPSSLEEEPSCSAFPNYPATFANITCQKAFGFFENKEKNIPPDRVEHNRTVITIDDESSPSSMDNINASINEKPVSSEKNEHKNTTISEQPSFFGNENTTLNTEEPFIDDEDFFRRLLQSTTVNSTPTNSTENTLEEIFKSYNL